MGNSNLYPILPTSLVSIPPRLFNIKLFNSDNYKRDIRMSCLHWGTKGAVTPVKDQGFCGKMSELEVVVTYMVEIWDVPVVTWKVHLNSYLKMEELQVKKTTLTI
ncbi:hypothetical protein Ahy_B08g093303 isoform B [Arachis hypogaea]|uniref:Uncharacterized protein n=1 Tax=Arachis hypogaea TaxID=3818 RepID=A0A444Y5R6_ARAHY|nr:hypothetical protein Ahy_B08g093303 isoform B [Arachis hypogaea]